MMLKQIVLLHDDKNVYDLIIFTLNELEAGGDVNVLKPQSYRKLHLMSLAY